MTGAARGRASGAAAALLVLACTPVTTRPAFRPDPQALVVLLNARPEPITTALIGLVRGDSLEVSDANVVDGYVETAWYDTRARRSLRDARTITDFAATVKLRFWADPYVPGQTRLTVEPMYRPRADPSRPERDLEVIALPGSPGYDLAHRFIDQLTERFGIPKAVR